MQLKIWPALAMEMTARTVPMIAWTLEQPLFIHPFMFHPPLDHGLLGGAGGHGGCVGGGGPAGGCGGAYGEGVGQSEAARKPQSMTSVPHGHA